MRCSDVTCYRGAMSLPLPNPPPGFDDLPIGDQIDYVQALWDRIAARADSVPVPTWHREELDRRLAEHEADPDAGEPWEAVRAELLRRSATG